ncbi:mucin-5AC-like, partial [Amphibalanus amphitrite]|uniref:mucin-5AC-like n=1 Tax=Amphibalanus amphitrite TaxID=1232801 RepID=UPI001C922FCB
CGDGKYLTLNADAFFIGGDHCERLAAAAAQRTRQQVVVCDALSLPFRDESVDAAVSVAVIHHLATTERRVRALRELARVLRIGGRLIVTVWAMEQRARKFESQDVLVPWDQSQSQSSSDQTSAAAEPDVTSTASEEDLLAYNAFTQNSDSDSTRSSRFLSRRATRRPRRVRAIDPKLPSSSQSSSDLSSPSESCYSFVRRALQKLARRGEIGAGRPRSFSPWPETSDAKPDSKADAKPAEDDDQLIEIRLDDDVSALEESTIANRGVPVAGQLATFKSHSVGDVWSLLAALRGAKRPDGTEERRGEAGRTSLPTDRPRSCPFDSVGLDSTQRRQTPARSANRKSVTFSTQSLTLPRDRPPPSDVVTAKSKSDSVLDARVRSCELLRAALSTVPETREAMDEAREVTDEAREAGDETRTRQKPALVRQQRCEEAVRRLSEAEANAVDTRIGRLTGKQSSLNENLIHSDRLLEREKLQSEIVKQRSLNDSYLYGKLENAETMPQDGFLASYKRLKIIRDSLGKLSESLEKIAENEPPTSSLKNGFVKMVRNWTDGGTAHAEHTDPAVDEPDPQTDAECPESSQSSSETCRVPDPPPMPPVPVQMQGPAANPDRSNAPPADLSAKPVTPATGSRIERRAMYRFASRERRTSKEESSDSSKENSFQSDTSLDSEDSCVSVIFVPKRETATNAVTENGVKPRSCSVSSESSGSSSPRSPRSLTSGPSSPTRAPGALARLNMLKTRPKLGPQLPLVGRFPLLAPPPGKTLPNGGDSTPSITPATTQSQTPSQKQTTTSPPAIPPRSKPVPAPSASESPPPTPMSLSTPSPAPIPPPLPPRPTTVPSPAEESKPSKDPVRDNPGPPDTADCPPRLSACPSCEMTALATNNSFRKSSAPPPADSVNNNVQVKLDAAAAAGALLDRRCVSSVAPSRSSGAARVELVTAAPVSALALQPSGGLEVVRRPGVQGLRAAGRAAPAFLTFEVFHPETDDLDSESSCGSSSDSSACSVLSQLADWPSSQELLDLDRDIELQQQEQREAEEGGTSKKSQDTEIGAYLAAEEQPGSAEKLRLSEQSVRTVKLENSERQGSAEKLGLSERCGRLKELGGGSSEEKLPELDRDLTVMEVQDVKLVPNSSLCPLASQERRPTDTNADTRPPLGSKTSSAEILEPADRAAAGTAAAASAGSVGSEFRSASPNELVSVDRVPSGPPSTTGRPPVTLSGGPEPRDALRAGSGPTALSSVIDESAPRAESSVGPDTVGEDPGRAAVTAVQGNSDAAEIDDVAKGGVFGAAVRSEECSGESGGSGTARCDPEQPAAVSSARCRRKVTLARLDAPPLERVAEEAETAAVRRRPVSSLGSASSMSEAETSRPPALAAARASSLSSSSAGSVGRRAPSLATARASPSSPWSSGSSVSDGLRAPSLATGRGSLTSTLSSASSLWTSDGSRAGHSHSWGSSRSTSEGATSLTEPSGAESPAGRPAADSATTARRIFDQAEADAAAAEVAAAAAAAAASEGSPEEADSQEASSEGSPRPDQGGTFGHHRYYHVFREGELDRLISKYVDNLHIISSYYDHANWCVVAEKVQVWTI